jgi:hypothetical protein
MTHDFGDGGEAYVKGERDEPVDWDKVARLEAMFQEIMAEPDGRLERAQALLAEMYGE